MIKTFCGTKDSRGESTVVRGDEFDADDVVVEEELTKGEKEKIGKD